MSWLGNWFRRIFGPKPQPPKPQPPTPEPPDPPPPSTVPTILLAIVNQKRQEHGCSLLTLHPQLGADAQKHSERMEQNHMLSHKLPGEKTPGDRVLEEGYAFSIMRENVAEGQETAKEVVDAWMSDPPHRANLLSSGCVHVGFGLAVTANGDYYWTAVLAAPFAHEVGDETAERIRLGAPHLCPL